MENVTNPDFTEHRIAVGNGNLIYAREYADNGPTLFLLHGFPDNIHLYDYLIPHLTAKFRIITFDFLGWHKSSKPDDYDYTADDQKMELATVIAYFNAENLWLMAHDASGPPAINYALENPDKIAKLILLNTYYSKMPTTRKPEAIWMFSTPGVRLVTGWVARNFSVINRLTYYNQVGKFMLNAARRKELVPKLYQSFADPKNFRAFLRLNRNLDEAVKANTAKVAGMAHIGHKTHIIFGAADPYLNMGVAHSFHKILPDATLNLIAEAGHYVQVDQPEQVAWILTGLV